jgi:ABC-type multidrug transport system fused ATPase/permease subunit
MEQNQPKTGKYALNFGLILGVISIVFSLMLYSLDMHYQGGFAVIGVSLIITIVFIVIGMMQFKKANNGFMSFGQALKIGIGISLIGGIIGALFNQVLMNFIDPDTMTKAFEYQREQLMAAGQLTAEQIDAQLEMGKSFATPLMQIAFGLVGSLFFGFILSLVPALILKKSQPED